MTFLKLIIRSLWFYRRTHWNVALGTALSAGILIGALTIGDSVSESLQDIVKSRLGNTEFVISAGGKLFPVDLAARLALKIKENVAPVLQLRGMVSASEGEKRVPNVQVYGVDSNFWKIGNCDLKIAELSEDEVVINQKLAIELNLKQNDDVVLRIEKASFVPLNAPFVPDDKNFIVKRLKIKQIIDKKQFGDFNLQNSQTSPSSVFLSLDILNKFVKLNRYANLLLIDNKHSTSTSQIENDFRNIWKLSDIGLKFRTIPLANKHELVSNRIFIEDTLFHLIKIHEKSAVPVFTYFFNSLKYNNLETPYSFISASGEAEVEALKDNELILNEWAANDLKARVGDSLDLLYFKVGRLRELEEVKTKFVLKQIVPISEKWADRTLMPEFEGLANVDKCTDWEAGIPVNFEKIRDKDEKYWKDFRGTPKAFVSNKTANKLWKNQYGNCTAIRMDLAADTIKLATQILQSLTPALAGFSVISVKQEGRWSASNAVDFSGLFIGLSFFLILAAFILTALLFSLNIDKREREHGILLSLGFSNKQIKNLLLIEGLIIAFLGSTLGIFFGLAFNKTILWFLNSLWNSVVRTNSIELHAKPITLVIGFAICMLIAFFIMLRIIRKKARFSISNLQKRNAGTDKIQTSKKPKLYLIISALSLVIIIGSAILMKAEAKFQSPGFYFLIGSLVMLGSISLIQYILIQIQGKPNLKINHFNIALQNLAFHRKRNLALISLLCIGTFITFSTGLNRTDFTKNSSSRQSGTGGFLFFAETTLPVLHNLNTNQGKAKYGLENLAKNIRFVQMHATKGDDASCLNLNRAVRPRIISVDPQEFASRNAFQFAEIDPSVSKRNTWLELSKPLTNRTYPAIADQTVILWGLGKKVGDTLNYANEKGDTIHLKIIAGLANSIFQGNILISDENFTQNFPSVAGTQILLIDAPKIQEQVLRNELETNMQNLGISVSNSATRLEMFNSITNTYLDIFLALGGIGLIIGTIGIAILISRSLLDRKRDLAMMQAVGINRNSVFRLFFIENLFSLISGIGIGLLAALIACYPTLNSPNSTVPYLVFLSLIFILFANGIFWIVFSIKMGLKKGFLSDLRNE